MHLTEAQELWDSYQAAEGREALPKQEAARPGKTRPPMGHVWWATIDCFHGYVERFLAVATPLRYLGWQEQVHLAHMDKLPCRILLGCDALGIREAIEAYHERQPPEQQEQAVEEMAVAAEEE
ncbi:UNVERIFIED_CONTAM: hypothetical protein K2H54_062064 [Gekko kuhli]